MLSQYISVVGAVGLAALAGVGVGDLTTEDNNIIVIRDELPKAIAVNEIQIFTDGSIIYDREVFPDEVLLVWSGQIFDENDKLYCSGGAPHLYKKADHKRFEKDVAWLVGDECPDLNENMTYFFTWSSPDGSFGNAYYPSNGLGNVVKK